MNSNKYNTTTVGYDAHQLARDVTLGLKVWAQAHDGKRATLKFHGHEMRINIESGIAVMKEPRGALSAEVLRTRRDTQNYFLLTPVEITPFSVGCYSEAPGFEDHNWLNN